MYRRSAITISLWHETEHGIVCMQIITHVLIISKISLNKRRLATFFSLSAYYVLTMLICMYYHDVAIVYIFC